MRTFSQFLEQKYIILKTLWEKNVIKSSLQFEELIQSFHFLFSIDFEIYSISYFN